MVFCYPLTKYLDNFCINGHPPETVFYYLLTSLLIISVFDSHETEEDSDNEFKQNKIKPVSMPLSSLRKGNMLLCVCDCACLCFPCLF